MNNMSLVYLLSQIFTALALIAQGSSYFINNRKSLLGVVIVSNICFGISFLLLGGYVGTVMSSIAIARDVVSDYINSRRLPEDKNKITKTDCWLLVLWLSLLSVGSYLTADGFLSILPFFSTTIFTIAIWQKNILFYRSAGLLTNTILIIYHIYLHNVVGMIFQFVPLSFVIMGLVSYLKNNKKIMK